MDEQLLVDFYDSHDITVDNDLFGGWYWYDALGFLISPTFTDIKDLEEWTIGNIEKMDKQYDKLLSLER